MSPVLRSFLYLFYSYCCYSTRVALSPRAAWNENTFGVSHTTYRGELWDSDDNTGTSMGRHGPDRIHSMCIVAGSVAQRYSV